jgi:PAS domain S-box-containing protein
MTHDTDFTGPRPPRLSAATYRADGRWWAAAVGIAIVVGLAALDMHWGGTRIVIATVLIAPFLVALLGSPTQTAAVGALAIVATAVSGSWNDNYGAGDYILRLTVVIAGAAFAILGARSRARLALDQRRFRLLQSVAEIADRPASVDETVRLLSNLLVPDFADVCVLDVVREDRVQRLAVAAHGPGATEIEEGLRRGSVAGHSEDGTAEQSATRLLVPLRARGRAIGSMALMVTSTSGRSYDGDDLEFAKVLGGRVALALDNAGLFGELESLEAQQSAVLGSLAEAVTVQNARGELVYANEAAARALGFATPEELLATPAIEIMDDFESFHEDGSAVGMDDLPGRQALRGEQADPLLVRAINRKTGEERWRLVKATAVRDHAGKPRLAVNVIEDVTDVKRAELGQRFLAQAGELLSSSLDYEETLAQVARLAVPELADWCGVSIPDERGYLRSVAVAHVDPDRVRFAREYNARYPARVDAPAGAARVLRDGVAQVVNEIPEDMLEQAVPDPEQLAALRSLGMRAVMIVPMVARGGPIGVITFVSAESGRIFTQADLDLAEELGRRAGTAVDNARLYSERSHIARTLQAGLLPEALPDIPGFSLAALYRPAGEENLVGGDFYDAFKTRAGWMIVVGDVTGRGAEAAALTAEARHTLRTAGTLVGDPAAAIAELNRSLAGKSHVSICTVVVTLLSETDAGMTATVVCAGHPLPLLKRGGEVTAVGGAGPIVGAWRDSSWFGEAFQLEPSDVLVFYTDGVTDARGPEDRFGDRRLQAAVRDASDAATAVAAVDLALQEFELAAQTDDTAVVAVQRLPEPVRPAPGVPNAEGDAEAVG